jgi:serine/threonine protein kinase
MPLSQNDELLVKALEAAALVDGRFERLQLMNFDALTDVKRGCFSLVFRAHDRSTGQDVALKFYSIDSAYYNDKYRRAAFLREHDILQALTGGARCLQVIAPYAEFQFSLPVGPGATVTIPCPYFAVEWIDADVDDYFLDQHKFDAATKLRLFSSIVSGVEALHRRGICHRDLKPDNLRLRGTGANRTVVAIDLGTAAKATSAPLLAQYGHSVGAPAYAAPEARCGLAGVRRIAPHDDVYALGCLLYELFNPGIFARELFTRNPRLQPMLVAISALVPGAATDEDRVKSWTDGLNKFAHGIVPVKIDGAGSSLPRGLARPMNELLEQMTHVDFRRRPINLEVVRQRLGSAIRAVENQAEYERRLALARDRRRRRNERAREKAERLERYLVRKVSNA